MITEEKGVSLGVFTWNPCLHFHLMRGGVEDFDEQVKFRTTKFTLLDRCLNYDSIEWQLDNNDGLMFMPEYVALGIIVGVRLGYAGSSAPWRYFVINRVKGEPGTRGTPDQAVGGRGATHRSAGKTGGAHYGAQVVYFGRTRNAKAPKKVGAGRKGKSKILAPTADLTSLDMALYTNGPRTLRGSTTAQVVTSIAEYHGFMGALQHIQEFNDTLDGDALSLPDSEPDGVFLQRLAKANGCLFYIDETGFHFHRRDWKGAPNEIQREYVVGGPDVLKVTIDGDFRLPAPSELTARGLNPLIRSETSAGATKTSGFFIEEILPLPAAQMQNLVRDYVLPVSAAGHTCDKKAVKNFIDRTLEKYKLTVDVVGDPFVRAKNRVKLSGTGTPFVDGVWYADEVRHTFSGGGGQTYVTTLTLKPVPKPAVGTRRVFVGHGSTAGAYKTGGFFVEETSQAGASAPGVGSSGAAVVKGVTSALRTMSARDSAKKEALKEKKTQSEISQELSKGINSFMDRTYEAMKEGYKAGVNFEGGGIDPGLGIKGGGTQTYLEGLREGLLYDETSGAYTEGLRAYQSAQTPKRFRLKSKGVIP